MDPLQILPWAVLEITVQYLGHGLSHYYGLLLNIPREGTLNDLADLGDEEKWTVNYSPAFLDHPQFEGKLLHRLVPRLSEYIAANPNHENVSNVLRNIVIRNSKEYLPQLLRGPLLRMCTYSSGTGNLPLQRAILVISLACITFSFCRSPGEKDINFALEVWRKKLEGNVMHDMCQREYGGTWYQTTMNDGSISVFSRHDTGSLIPLYFFIFSGEHGYGDDEDRKRMVFLGNMRMSVDWNAHHRYSDRQFLVPYLCDEDKEALRRLGSTKGIIHEPFLMG